MDNLHIQIVRIILAFVLLLTHKVIVLKHLNLVYQLIIRMDV